MRYILEFLPSYKGIDENLFRKFFFISIFIIQNFLRCFQIFTRFFEAGGDVAEVHTPVGVREYEILDVKYE